MTTVTMYCFKAQDNAKAIVQIVALYCDKERDVLSDFYCCVLVISNCAFVLVDWLYQFMYQFDLVSSKINQI